jgi:hypothetical protein
MPSRTRQMRGLEGIWLIRDHRYKVGANADADAAVTWRAVVCMGCVCLQEGEDVNTVCV